MALMWEASDKMDNEAELTKFEDEHYDLTVECVGLRTSASIRLDRKRLKELFNAIGHELNAFG